ncbi:MAG TPA: dTMP kinase [Pirellulales bacterium]|jgi:dTMP kinase|nr:dTMP kinase [Pirellulales bacterium]
MPGLFFSFDGIDGVGKSTQSALFGEWLAARGHEVVFCRDPGSTPLGEEIRRLLLDPAAVKFDRTAEMLLYMAARAQLVDQVIAPALAAGKTVISDRFLLANVVYQGHAGGLDPAAIWEVGRVAIKGIEPALTFVLDLPEQEAAARLTRELDRMESQGEAFHRRLRQGYLAEGARNPAKIVILDASRPVEPIQADIRKQAEKVLRHGD